MYNMFDKLVTVTCKGRGTFMSNLVLMLKIMMPHTHTSRGYEKAYSFHN